MNWSEVIARLVMEKLRIKLLSSIGGIEAKLQHFVGRNNSGLADTDYNGAREKKRRPIADNCVNIFSSAYIVIPAQQKGYNFIVKTGEIFRK